MRSKPPMFQRDRFTVRLRLGRFTAIVGILVAALVMASGCATIKDQAVSVGNFWNSADPVAKADFLAVQYRGLWDRYNMDWNRLHGAMITSGPEVEALRIKRQILVETHGPLTAYAMAAQALDVWKASGTRAPFPGPYPDEAVAGRVFKRLMDLTRLFPLETVLTEVNQ